MTTTELEQGTWTPDCATGGGKGKFPLYHYSIYPRLLLQDIICFDLKCHIHLIFQTISCTFVVVCHDLWRIDVKKFHGASSVKNLFSHFLRRIVIAVCKHGHHIPTPDDTTSHNHTIGKCFCCYAPQKANLRIGSCPEWKRHQGIAESMVAQNHTTAVSHLELVFTIIQ